MMSFIKKVKTMMNITMKNHTIELYMDGGIPKIQIDLNEEAELEEITEEELVQLSKEEKSEIIEHLYHGCNIDGFDYRRDGKRTKAEMIKHLRKNGLFIFDDEIQPSKNAFGKMDKKESENWRRIRKENIEKSKKIQFYQKGREGYESYISDSWNATIYSLDYFIESEFWMEDTINELNRIYVRD
jgi:hypothetical protein